MFRHNAKFGWFFSGQCKFVPVKMTGIAANKVLPKPMFWTKFPKINTVVFRDDFGINYLYAFRAKAFGRTKEVVVTVLMHWRLFKISTDRRETGILRNY